MYMLLRTVVLFVIGFLFYLKYYVTHVISPPRPTVKQGKVESRMRTRLSKSVL